MDAALSGDGASYAVVSCDISGSDVTTEVMSGKCDSESAVTATISDAMALDVGFFSDGSFCVVCDNAIAFFSKEGQLTAEHRLDAYGICGISFSGDRVMTVESDNIVESRNVVTVYDIKGEKVLTHDEENKVAASALGESAVFLAFDGKLTKIAFDGSVERTDCSLSVSSLVPFSDNVLVLGQTSAVTGFEDGAENKNEAAQSSDEIDAEFSPIE